jgi:hypothetical protein
MTLRITTALLVIAALTILGFAGHALYRLDKAVKAHGPFIVLGRLLTGIHLQDGRHHWTNAGWFTRRGDVKVLHRSGRVSWWQHQNLAFRTMCRSGPLLAVAGFFVDRVADAAAVAAVVVILIALRTRRGHEVVRRALRKIRGHKGNRVRPMADGMADITGASAKSALAGVKWNPDYAKVEPGEWVATWGNWPPGFRATGKDRAAFEHLWRSRVGFDLTFDWRTSEEEPEVVMARARELPGKVFLHEWVDELDKLSDDKTGIGPSDQNELQCWAWSSENPHAVVNAGSRHGKTELLKGMAAQVLRKGGTVTVIDPKEISFQGMAGVPGLVISNDPSDSGIAAMWEEIGRFRAEMDRRRKERAKDPTAEFKRALLILEEVNQFSEQSDELWENLAECDPGTENTVLWKPKRAKKTPPVWRHVKAVAWQGAAFKMHIIVDGQDVQATVLKGVRNSLGMRLLGGYLPQQWKYLVGTTPVPAAPTERGRWCLVRGVDQIWLQSIIADLDPDESSAIWRDYARAGRRMDGTLPVTEGVTEPVNLEGSAAYHGNETAGRRVFTVASAGVVTGGDPRGEPVSLSEAVDGGHAPGATVKALRQDRYLSDRKELPDGLKFPEPVVEVRPGQTARFWSSEIAAFNEARRGRRVA